MRRPSRLQWFAEIGPVIVAASFLAQLVIVSYAAHHGVLSVEGARLNGVPGTRPLAEWYESAPFRIVGRSFRNPHYSWAGLVALGALQSAALYGTYRAIATHGFGRRARGVTIACALAMAVAAFATPVLTSADAYAYIGYGFAPSYRDSLVGLTIALPPQFTIINDMYGRPLIPNVYGPAFYGLVSFVRLWHVPLAVDLYTIRALGTAAFAGILLLIGGRLSVGSRVVLALSPALYFDWVFDAHNDVYAVLCAAVAFRLMPRNVVGAVIAAAAAAAFKLTMFPVALTLSAMQPTLPRRILVASAMLVVSLTVLFVCEGSSFIHALAPHLTCTGECTGTTSQEPLETAQTRTAHVAVRTAGYLAVVVVIALAVLRARATAGAAFVFSALVTGAYPWYLVWGIPYAAMSDAFAFVPIALPALTAFSNPELAPRLPLQVIVWGFAIASALVFAFLGRYPDVSLRGSNANVPGAVDETVREPRLAE